MKILIHILSFITTFMQKIFIFFVSVLLYQCSIHNNKIIKKNNSFIIKSLTSDAHNERIKFLILHYTALNDEDSLNILTKSQVSAHYLIPQYPKIRHGKPIIFQLVDEKKRAWHAGHSTWNGRINLNDTSVGIEIVNPGFSYSIGKKIWYPYTKKQIKVIIMLIKDIIYRYKITPDNILGHSDITPLRKYDPGKFFPWKQLASEGIGAWPEKNTVKKYLKNISDKKINNVLAIQKMLNQYGYNQIPQHGIFDENTKKIIIAFQMHFRSNNINGIPDAETLAIANALIEKYR